MDELEIRTVYQSNLMTFMESKLYRDIILPRPEVSSPSFPEQVNNLGDALDEIIESMLMKLSITTGQGKIDLQNEIDVGVKEFVEDQGRWRWKSGSGSYRRRNRGKKSSNSRKPVNT